MSLQPNLPISRRLIGVVIFYSMANLGAGWAWPTNVGSAGVLSAASARHRVSVEDRQTWTWTAPKRLKTFVGEYQLKFERSHSFKDLPPVLEELSTQPWREIYKDPISVFESPRPLLNQRPILELRQVDIGELVTYHQTSFKAVDGFVRLSEAEPLAKGHLDETKIRMTNGQKQPAFYTQLDVAASILEGLPQDLIFKIRVAKSQKVTVLSLLEPTDAEATFLFHRLTGDPDYWRVYKEQNAKGDVYDFDLFQNAVVKVLREKYGYQIDLMLYLNSFEQAPMNVGTPQTWTYAWPVFYKRELLRDAKVEQIYYYPYSTAHSAQATGTNDWLYVAIGKDFIQTMIANPILHETLKRWATSTPYFKLQESLGVESGSFWAGDYMNRTQRYLAREGFRELKKKLALNPNANGALIDTWVIEIVSPALKP